MTDYVLAGGGAFAREIFDWFEPVLAGPGSKIVGYLDDGDAPMQSFGRRLPHLGPFAAGAHPAGSLILALTVPADKAAVVARFGPGAFGTFVHPGALISGSAKLGAGVIVGPFAMVSADAVVGTS